MLFSVLLGLCAVSAVWVESDLYRYILGPLSLYGLYRYFFRPEYPGARISVVETLCLLWSAYVAVRVGIPYLKSDQAVGSAEGLYIFPLVFSALGYAVLCLRKKLGLLPDFFVATSLIFLLATLQLPQVFSDEHVPFLIQNNTIHASVAAGFILLLCFAYATYARETRALHSTGLFHLRLALTSLVIILCLIGIFGAKSKGVWLALFLAIPFQIIMTLLPLPRRKALWTGFAILLIAAILLFLGWDIVLQQSDDHFQAVLRLMRQASTRSIGSLAHDAIQSTDTPFSLRERLELWTNASEVWSSNLLFGAGPEWIDLWKKTTYSSIGYNLMHNGYFEIAIRYGIFGLAFFALLYLAFARVILRAYQAGAIPYSLLQAWFGTLLFFAITLLSNSNNRLAIGETYILLSAAIAFYSHFRLEEDRLRGAVEPAQTNASR